MGADTQVSRAEGFMRFLSVMLLTVLAGAGCEPPRERPLPPEGKVTRIASLQGEVRERFDAAPYSYLRLDTAEGETWVAVPIAAVGKGTRVTIAGATPVRGFEAKGIGRRFGVVYFGSLGGKP
jgi:hypothetical protein